MHMNLVAQLIQAELRTAKAHTGVGSCDEQLIPL